MDGARRRRRTGGSRSESYLAYLAAMERSPNTQRAYATSLKLWFEFLERIGGRLDGRSAVDDVARFVAWLRAPGDNVVVLDAGDALRSPATVNRHLAAVFGFYEHHARFGVDVARAWWRGVGSVAVLTSRSCITSPRDGAVPTRPIKLAVPRRAPRTLTRRPGRGGPGCAGAGPRSVLVGVAGRDRNARSVRRSACATPTSSAEPRRCASCPGPTTPMAPGRSCGEPAAIPVTAGLVRCYSDYMHAEYGDIDSDYVFVNLWAGRIGAPMTYAAVHELVGRIRARTGVEFTAAHAAPHARHRADPFRRGDRGRGPAAHSSFVDHDQPDLRASRGRRRPRRAASRRRVERARGNAVTTAGTARHLRARPGAAGRRRRGRGRIRQGHVGRAASRRSPPVGAATSPASVSSANRGCGRRSSGGRGSGSAAGYSFTTIDSGAQSLARFSLFLARASRRATASLASPESCWRTSWSWITAQPDGRPTPAITPSRS